MNNHPDQSVPCSEPSCGKPLKFITMKKSGKLMPVDAKMIIASEGELKGTFVLTNGTIVKSLQKGQAGYVPHWSTCVKANKFRKGEKK